MNVFKFSESDDYCFKQTPEEFIGRELFLVINGDKEEDRKKEHGIPFFAQTPEEFLGLELFFAINGTGDAALFLDEEEDQQKPMMDINTSKFTQTLEEFLGQELISVINRENHEEFSDEEFSVFAQTPEEILGFALLLAINVGEVASVYEEDRKKKRMKDEENIDENNSSCFAQTVEEFLELELRSNINMFA